MKITFSWTYDECLEQARRFVGSQHIVAPTMKEPETWVSDLADTKPIYEVKGKVYKLGRPVDIHVGSKESGFVFHKKYCSILAASDSIGASSPTVCRCLKDGSIYKGIYKFFYSS